MADITTVGGIIIPVSVVQTGDKQAYRDVESFLGRLTGLTNEYNRTGKEQETVVKGLNKELNTLRWSYVNLIFVAGAVTALATPFIFAMKAANDFELQLRKIQAATGETLASSQSTILSAKAGTPFSKNDVADAYLTFAKAGFDATESSKALTSVLRLAQIGFIDANDAADTLAQTLHQFNMSATDSTKIVDELSSVADRSKTDIEGLTSSLSYVGPIAEGMNQDFGQTVEILGLLSNAGLDASRAGTSLRQILAALADPSAKAQAAMSKLGVSFIDSQGNVKQLSTFIVELNNSLSKLSAGDKQEALASIFEVRALAGVQALLNKVDELGGSLDSIKEQGYTTGQAMVKEFIVQEAAVNKLTTATEGFKDKFLEAGQAMSQSLTPEIIHGIEVIGSILAKSVEGIAFLVTGVLKLGDALWAIIPAITLAAIGIGYLTGGASFLAATAAGVGAFIGLILAQGALVRGLEGAAKGLGIETDTAMTQASAATQGLSDAMATANSNMMVLTPNAQALVNTFNSIPALSDKMIASFGEQGVYVVNLVKSYDLLIGKQEAVVAQIAETKAALVTAGKSKTEIDSDPGLLKLAQNLANITGSVLNVRLELDKLATTSNAFSSVTEGAKNFAAAFANITSGPFDAAIKDMKEKFNNDFFDKLLGTDQQYKFTKALEPLMQDAAAALASSTSTNVLDAFGSSISTDTINLSAFVGEMQQYGDSLRDAESQIVELESKKDQLKDTVDRVTDSLNQEKRELQDLQDEYQKTKKRIDELSNASFTGQTETQHIINLANLYMKEQELSALGVADAQQFITDTLHDQGGEYDSLFARLIKINSAMEDNKDAFKAWQDTIKEAIKAEVEAGDTLGADVTDRVQQWQTALLGISQTQGGSGGQATALDDFVNKLQLAYDVHFGGMQEDVSNFLNQQQDKELGVFDTSNQLISALQTQIGYQDDLSSAIEAQTSVVNRKFAELQEATQQLTNTEKMIGEYKDKVQTTLEAIAKLAPTLTSAMDTIRAKVAQLGSQSSKPKTDYNSGGSGGSSGGNSSNSTPSNANTSTPNGPVYVPPGGNVPNFQPVTGPPTYVPPPMNYTPAPNASFPTQNASFPKYNDFIMRPGAGAASFSPDDTIIGVKDTSSLGGGCTITIGDIHINGGQNLKAEDIGAQIAAQIRRELNTRA